MKPENNKSKKYNQLLQQLLKLALKHPESGILRELVFMNEVELQAAVEMLERFPED